MDEVLSELTAWGESLKRPPKGFDPEHPHTEDLKHKDFVLLHQFDEQATCKPDFIDEMTEACRKASPYVEFLTTAIGLEY